MVRDAAADRKIHVTDFYISKMTGTLCITVSSPITDENGEMAEVFGVDVKSEEWAKRSDNIAEATRIVLKAE